MLIGIVFFIRLPARKMPKIDRVKLISPDSYNHGTKLPTAYVPYTVRDQTELGTCLGQLSTS